MPQSVIRRPLKFSATRSAIGSFGRRVSLLIVGVGLLQGEAATAGEAVGRGGASPSAKN